MKPYFYSPLKYAPLPTLLGQVLLSSSQGKGTVGGGKTNLSIRNVDIHSFSCPMFSSWLEGEIVVLLTSQRNSAWVQNLNLPLENFALKPASSYGFYSYLAPAGHYKFHSDNGFERNGKYTIRYPERHLSAIYYLNDNFEGGDLILRCPAQEEHRISPKAGHLLLFPSTQHFPHKVEPITSGLRVCVVNWFSLLPNGESKE